MTDFKKQEFDGREEGNKILCFIIFILHWTEDTLIKINIKLRNLSFFS